MKVEPRKRGNSRLLTSHISHKNIEKVMDGFAGSLGRAARTGRSSEVGAGAPIMPKERDDDLEAAMRAWFASQPRASAKLAIAPPASPSRIEATKNAMANFQPNKPAL